MVINCVKDKIEHTKIQWITITVKREDPSTIEANGNYVWFKEVESLLDTIRGTISFQINKWTPILIPLRERNKKQRFSRF